jgi:hypothetical protein
MDVSWRLPPALVNSSHLYVTETAVLSDVISSFSAKEELGAAARGAQQWGGMLRSLRRGAAAPAARSGTFVIANT